jgi:hypothetical protein
MKTKKVGFLMSIAGLGDPDIPLLDRQYQEIRARYEKMGASEKTIDRMIEERKLKDGYNRKPIGLPKDWAFKIGDVADVPADLADKWVESRICQILPDSKKAQAS